MKTFEVGKIYFMRSICDYNCIWRYRVVNRTKATITIQEIDRENNDVNKPKMCRIIRSNIFGFEAVRPLGSYSMAPVLGADREYIS